jgi:hypothetical protein
MSLSRANLDHATACPLKGVANDTFKARMERGQLPGPMLG